MATGHSVWGILNAPATGEAFAELILDGAARSTDLSPFDPARLTVLDSDRISVTRRRTIISRSPGSYRAHSKTAVAYGKDTPVSSPSVTMSCS